MRNPRSFLVLEILAAVAVVGVIVLLAHLWPSGLGTLGG